ncbi:hypothetical protein CTheo_3222 [Ceratobasidium theobromae]|uniref:Uncharacterized protein n=1 Tax=Ceratobasidium theobromae TaxID=1582974 RepID=A0A5N5QNN8_9AGAM|nr:hypothetical protein CTheo_3222 [Ceratobasidium theobromae]
MTRSRFLVSERALNLATLASTPTGSVSCASSASSSSSSFAVRRKLVPHACDATLVSLGIVLVVSSAQPDTPRRPPKRPRALDRDPKLDIIPREQPRYRPPPPDVPLPTRRPRSPPARRLPLYHPLRPLPPLPVPDPPSAPVEPALPTRSSARTRRPPPRNLEHLIVAVSNTARQRQASPAKKRKVDMDDDPDAKRPDDTEDDSARARRLARRTAKDLEATPPRQHDPPKPPSRAARKPPAPPPRSAPRRATRRSSADTSSDEKDAPLVSRRTSSRRSALDPDAFSLAVAAA